MRAPCLALLSALLVAAPAAAAETAIADAGHIRVNQLGYLPTGPKRATLLSDAPAPQPFRVRDAGGTVVFDGMSEPRGIDAAAGVAVHVLDFTAMTAAGDGFVLEVGDERSWPFDVDKALYAGLPADAFSYFYPVRSGVEISSRIAGKGYGRPAGHLGHPGGDGANTGDFGVPCQPAGISAPIYGEAWTCDYTLDVTGGWYDAGDTGKYVVNGAIAVAQLMAAWARELAVSDGIVAAPAGKLRLADGTLRLPEIGNRVPDVLDEARWELEWLLKMVVPDGMPLAGMAHHKVHDARWGGAFPQLPSDDSEQRLLHRPSTAATLDLAAVAAQGARLFGPYDPGFAHTLLLAARRAYAAARAHPDLYAPPADGNSGGGAYSDDDVRDEFYWAAAELFLSTGDAGYLAELKASPYWSATVFSSGGAGNTAPFARLELAANLDRLAPADAELVRRSVLAAGDDFIGVQQRQPFGQVYMPMGPYYAWGSNALVINNALVLAAAYDLGGDERYRQAALEAMDYIFGRNVLGQSYVTGYGRQFSHNQHSGWFAHGLDSDFPPPPVGALAGGANSGLEDPVMHRLYGDAGCAAQACYVDDIEAWSVNEIAINWNSALGQMAAWLADQ